MLRLTINNNEELINEADQDEAMRRYWEATQAGDTTARLLRVDDPPPDRSPHRGDDHVDGTSGDPANGADHDRPTHRGSDATSPGTVSAVAVDRTERHERMLAQRGIALPPPVYAAGTKVVALGEATFRTSRREWEAMPETIDGLRGVYEAVNEEKREDHTVRVQQLRMGPDGTLDFGEGPVLLEEQGLRALVSRNADVFPRAGEYLALVDPELRAANFNQQIQYVDSDRDLKLRTTEGPAGRQVFAVTSPRYASFDADEIAVLLAGALRESGMRGEVVYDPMTTNLRVDGIYHADQVVDLAAGDVFKMGVQFRSNDAAGGSIRGVGIAWRNLCLNLIIIGTGTTELLRRKHIGAVAEVSQDVAQAAAAAKDLFADFAVEWGVLRRTPAADVFTSDSMPDIVEELAAMSELDVGIKRDVRAEVLLTSWRREPGESLADLVNAVTGAHALADIDNWRRERFEGAAGQLVPVLAARAA